jgi:hypothetical protein
MLEHLLTNYSYLAHNYPSYKNLLPHEPPLHPTPCFEVELDMDEFTPKSVLDKSAGADPATDRPKSLSNLSSCTQATASRENSQRQNPLASLRPHRTLSRPLLPFSLLTTAMAEDKWIGLAPACSSSLAIGTSFIGTKRYITLYYMQHVEANCTLFGLVLKRCCATWPCFPECFEQSLVPKKSYIVDRGDHL